MFLPRYCTGDEIKECDTEGTCGWRWEKKNAQRILMGKPMGQDHGEGLGADGRISLKWILKS
jgi:hypothetical protein